jgi:hypothetical protein
MLAALAVALVVATPAPALDPKHLPPLPERGLARQQGNAVVLETLRGRPLGRLAGLSLAIPRATHGLLLADRRGRFFSIDLYQHRVRQVFRMPERYPGCRFIDATMRDTLLLCGRRIDVIRNVQSGRQQRSVLARAPDRHGGSWAWAEFAPNGHDVLAEWSGQCEIPTAFLISGGKVRPYGAATYAHAPQSEALGWLPDGRAIVQFDFGACGGGIRAPGVYAVPRHGSAQLLRPTARDKPVLLSMWGG